MKNYWKNVGFTILKVSFSGFMLAGGMFNLINGFRLLKETVNEDLKKL